MTQGGTGAVQEQREHRKSVRRQLYKNCRSYGLSMRVDKVKGQEECHKEAI